MKKKAFSYGHFFGGLAVGMIVPKAIPVSRDIQGIAEVGAGFLIRKKDSGFGTGIIAAGLWQIAALVVKGQSPVYTYGAMIASNMLQRKGTPVGPVAPPASQVTQ